MDQALEQPAHRLAAAVIAAEGLHSRRLLLRQAHRHRNRHRADQHQPLDPVRVGDRVARGHPGALRIAEQCESLEPDRVHERREMVDAALQAVRRRAARVGAAEAADGIERDDPIFGRNMTHQRRHARLAGGTRPTAVRRDDDRAVAPALGIMGHDPVHRHEARA
jgi:hypothetical protein